MRRADFYFDLPKDKIARYPTAIRGQDKLMELGRFDGAVSHHVMAELPDLIAPGTLMVFNDSKVRRARVYGTREDTGRIQEFLFLQKVAGTGDKWNVLVHNAKRQKPSIKYIFPENVAGQILSGNEGMETRTILLDRCVGDDWFERNGHVPLPPYIGRDDDETDNERYQTVYAKTVGSAACPTAGLHFTNDMLNRLASRGIETAFITLHVGLGTFLPVREDIIEEHKMHSETFSISFDIAAKINKAKHEGRAVLCVGTTSARTLESAADESGTVQAGSGETHIFIYPGYKWKVVDQMFTNFHTPESTLIMMVSAFSTRENILNAYKTALNNGYRFFSYGDAMLIK